MLALSGCAAITGITGVTVRDGQVIALVRICGDYTSDAVELWTSEDSDNLGFWDVDGSIADIELGSIDSIVQMIGSDRVSLSGRASDGLAEEVQFKREDLQSLRAGNVLLRGGPTTAPTTLELTAFDALVADKCDGWEN